MYILLRRSILPGLLFVLSFLSAYHTQDDYGPHWDAHHYLARSMPFGTWLRSFVTGEEVPHIWDVGTYFRWERDHPPLAKILMGITNGIFRDIEGEADSARLAVLLCYAALVSAIFAFCRYRMGVWPALLAALLFWSMPRAFCHGHLIALDLVVTLFVFAAVMAFEATRDRRWAWAVCGILLGLALLTKLQAGFVPLILACWLVWDALAHDLPEIRWRWHRWVNLFAACALAGIVFFLGWPYLWRDPIGGIKTYLDFIFQRKEIDVFYLGRAYGGEDVPPWHYPFVMIAVTTPVGVLLAGLTGFGAALWRKAPTPSFGRLLVAGFMVPLLIVAFPGAKKYDGIRMLLPALPFLACLGGFGLWRVLRLWDRYGWSRQGRGVLIGCSLVILPAFGLVGTFRYHPHEILYYNLAVGGFRGAYRLGFDADYLGLSMNKAWPVLNRRVPDGSFLFIGGANTAHYFSPVGSPDPGESRNSFLKKTVRVVSLAMTGDFVRSPRGMATVLNTRRAGLGREGENVITRCEPEWTYRFRGIPLIRLYRYPASHDEFPETLHRFRYVEIVSAAHSPEEGRLEIMWRLMRRAPPLGLNVIWRGGDGTEICRWEFDRLYALYPTELWLPGDVIRATYEIPPPDGRGSLLLEVIDMRTGEKRGSVVLDELPRMSPDS